MDIKKLQIGDYVYNTHHEKIIKLTAYDFFTHGHNKHGAQYLTTYIQPTLGRDLEPIPLTEKFLVKNGFVETTEEFMKPNRFFRTKDGRVEVGDLTNSGDGYWNVHIDNEDFDTISSCDVKYVHQFQQLLRLCGYEMDVVV